MFYYKPKIKLVKTEVAALRDQYSSEVIDLTNSEVLVYDHLQQIIRKFEEI